MSMPEPEKFESFRVREEKFYEKKRRGMEAVVEGAGVDLAGVSLGHGARPLAYVIQSQVMAEH